MTLGDWHYPATATDLWYSSRQLKTSSKDDPRVIIMWEGMVGIEMGRLTELQQAGIKAHLVLLISAIAGKRRSLYTWILFEAGHADSLRNHASMLQC